MIASRYLGEHCMLDRNFHFIQKTQNQSNLAMSTCKKKTFALADLKAYNQHISITDTHLSSGKLDATLQPDMALGGP